MPLSAGEKIGRYTIEEILGSGGMGEVYRARDERLQRTVALKILRSPPRGTEEGTRRTTGGGARMLREARAAAALEHPNVVVVYDVGEVIDHEELRGTTFLAMELVKGRSLRASLCDPSVPIASRLRWIADIARALGAAHKAGLVHRDVKPENVMIREDGVVKVLDFGIAKRSGQPVDAHAATELPSATTDGVVIGTPYYMAPEQLRNEPLDGRADQFAWAVLSYEVLCGVPPWSLGVDGLHLVAEVLSREPPLVDEKNPEVPRHVTAVIARAMSKAKQDRYPSMQAVVEALESPTAQPMTLREKAAPALASRGLESVHTESSTVTPAPPGGQRPRLRFGYGAALGVAAAIAALVVVAFAVLRSGIKARPVTPPSTCASSAACTSALGAPSRCVRSTGQCLRLASDDCRVLAESAEIADDATVWVGTLLPVSGVLRSAGRTRTPWSSRAASSPRCWGSSSPRPGRPPCGPSGSSRATTRTTPSARPDTCSRSMRPP